MSENLLFHGPASEVITTFDSNGRVDLGLIAEEIRYMIDRGVTGIFVNGLASEALMFPEPLRIDIAKTVIKAADGRIPVVGNLIYNSNDMASECIKAYEAAGADAVIITPPLIYKFPESSLIEYITGIANATDLPVYIYNAPESGNKLSPELLAKVIAACDNIRGYKDSTQDIIGLETFFSLIGKDRHFEVMSGSDATILPTYQLGGVGVFSLITCVFPELIAELCDACGKGEWARAQALQNKVLRVRKALKVGPFMAAYKYVGTLNGAPLGCVKRPMADVNDAEKAKIRDLLEKENML